MSMIFVIHVCLQFSGIRVGEFGGFLKYIHDLNPDYSHRETYQCHNTEEYYVWDNNEAHISGSKCSNDPHFYQVCDKRIPGFKVTNNGILCGNRLCDEDPNRTWFSDAAELHICDGDDIDEDCGDNEDKRKCIDELKTTLHSGMETWSRLICDDRCDLNMPYERCEEEANCNSNIRTILQLY